jgi:integrase
MKKKAHQRNLPLFDNKTEKKEGTILRKPGSKKLYILCYHCGRRVEKTTGLDDSEINREKVRAWLDRIIEKRNAGTLIFADAFPGASEQEKKIFAELEGRYYSPQLKDICMGDYIDKWIEEVVPLYSSHTKREDHLAIVKCWIRPYFAEKTFYDFTKLELQKFVATFKLKIGKNKGKPLSRARAANIITVLRTLFDDAVDEYHWENIPDPFRKIKRFLPTTPPQIREIFRLGEWLQIVESIHPWYQPMIEFMMLTGMIHSEISGLQRPDIRPDHIMVQQSIVRKVESPSLKTRHRIRKIPITQHLRTILNEVLARTNSIYVFAEPDGSPYLREGFVEDFWTPAIQAAGVYYRPPYSIRHSFAAWSLLVGIDPLRLVRLMGHGSKQMVFEVYGNYIDGLEKDYWDILNYFGKDYVEVKRKPLPFYQNVLGESFGESQGFLEVQAT